MVPPPTIKSGAFAPGEESMAFDEGNLYRNEADAAAKFEKIIADPPPLRHFLDRLTADTFDMPTVLGDRFVIDTFRLGDVPAERRELAEAMLASLRG